MDDSEQQILVSSFLEIAVDHSADTARQFLQATGWNLEEAIQLYFVGNEGGVSIPPSTHSPPRENNPPLVDPIPREQEMGFAGQDDGNDVRAPLPVIRDVLYESPMLYGLERLRGLSHGAHSVVPFRNFEDEMKHPAVWDGEQGSSSSSAGGENKTQDNLASLYRPPLALMFRGPFEKAKENARVQNKWLLVNMQSTREFNSHMLNRDTWAHETVFQTIKTNFIFWQVNDDTEEGSKVCTYYKIQDLPAVLVVDPLTGQKMKSWRGMVQPETLLEDLLPFMDGSPSDQHVSFSHKRPRETSQSSISDPQDKNNEEDEALQRALAVSMENNGISVVETNKTEDAELEQKVKRPNYLPLPEEPKGDRNMLCRVGIRLPDGRRSQRNFLRNDPIQLLWSFCVSELKEDGDKPFRLTHAIPGASKSLDFDDKSTFESSGLANSMISVTWDE